MKPQGRASNTRNTSWCVRPRKKGLIWKTQGPSIVVGGMLHHAHPAVAAAGKTCRMQRSRGLGNRVVVSKNCYNLYADCAPMWLLQTKLLASLVWKRGCQPFSCRCTQNVTYCRKEICSTCLSNESIPAIRLWNSKHPLPARATSSALWLHHAQPFVAAAEINLSHDEKQRVWSRSCFLQDLLQCSDCALSCAMWLLQTNQQLSRLSF